MPASWQEMQDLGYVVHTPTTGRILPTQKSSLAGIGQRLRDKLGLSGGTLRSGSFAGYQSAVHTNDPYGEPETMRAARNDLAAIAASVSPGDALGLGILEVNLHNQHLRGMRQAGLSGINQDRAGRICAATSAVGQITTAIGMAASTSTSGGTKTGVKGQGSTSGWETANTIAQQTDEVCGALFSASSPPTPPQSALPPVLQTPPPATGPSGFGSNTNNMLLYAGGAVAFLGVLYLLKD